MKKIALVMAVVAAMMFNNLAGAEEKESTFSGSLDVGFYGQYVDELSGGTLFNKSVIQPSLTISHKSGAYLNFWGSDGLKGGSDSRELDVSLGIAKEIGKLKIDGGYSYVNLQNLRNTKGDLHAFYLYVDGPVVLGITPFVMTELDIPVDREILEGGFLYRIGGKGSVKIAEQAIDVSLSVGGHDGAYGTRPELVSYGRCTLSTEISVGKLSITPEVSYQHRLGYAAEDGGMIEKKDKVWGGINLSYAF